MTRVEPGNSRAGRPARGDRAVDRVGDRISERVSDRTVDLRAVIEAHDDQVDASTLASNKLLEPKDVRPWHLNVGIPAKSIRVKPNAPPEVQRTVRLGGDGEAGDR